MSVRLGTLNQPRGSSGLAHLGGKRTDRTQIGPRSPQRVDSKRRRGPKNFPDLSTLRRVSARVRSSMPGPSYYDKENTKPGTLGSFRQNACIPPAWELGSFGAIQVSPNQDPLPYGFAHTAYRLLPTAYCLRESRILFMIRQWVRMNLGSFRKNARIRPEWELGSFGALWISPNKIPYPVVLLTLPTAFANSACYS